ncbi:hypothetical protein B7P43_G13932 [Cryptotermes secundus]|uniref:Uncharacterized protein n=1 Tax=Cryptotermes secundus TaxID=105785 RepID=A0A2J7RRC1_9NEOP|nr:hypothetical protein B7P43_G13932 [Cryptotermes secundus]
MIAAGLYHDRTTRKCQHWCLTGIRTRCHSFARGLRSVHTVQCHKPTPANFTPIDDAGVRIPGELYQTRKATCDAVPFAATLNMGSSAKRLPDCFPLPRYTRI